MSPELWAFLGTDVAVLGSVVVAYFQFRKPVKKLGNGFSERVEQELSEIKQIAQEARDEIREHKNAHVEASMRRIS